ncbi:hypothetical protein PR048_002267 [Dryococelus australis]|uniref:Uncharacterized protein n=1 Tax=Dryococelus australis TaxID=614101 RepID=A0ABQ9IJV8_9NEOP|nr:hypothetical protein PR048_002267 [Dryococelus australis]
MDFIHRDQQQTVLPNPKGLHFNLQFALMNKSPDLNLIDHLWDELDRRRGSSGAAQNPLFNSWNGCKRNGDESPWMSCKHSLGGRGGVVVRLLASHLGEPGYIPSEVGPRYFHVGIVPNDTSGRRVFSGISRRVPALLHPRLASPSSALKTSLLRSAQISPLHFTPHRLVTLSQRNRSASIWANVRHRAIDDERGEKHAAREVTSGLEVCDLEHQCCEECDRQGGLLDWMHTSFSGLKHASLREKGEISKMAGAPIRIRTLFEPSLLPTTQLGCSDLGNSLVPDCEVIIFWLASRWERSAIGSLIRRVLAALATNIIHHRPIEIDQRDHPVQILSRVVRKSDFPIQRCREDAENVRGPLSLGTPDICNPPPPPHLFLSTAWGTGDARAMSLFWFFPCYELTPVRHVARHHLLFPKGGRYSHVTSPQDDGGKGEGIATRCCPRRAVMSLASAPL